MRLTLRTLLAYRDGVLSPADSEDLHRRIQSSHDAGNLLKRIGSVTRMNQVLAPPLFGKGLGGDANSIAEYLDDALQHSQVPELERICLVADVQLAELADCHTLLSTAMSTKVTVPAALRRSALEVIDPQARAQLVSDLEARKAPRRKRRKLQSVVTADAPQTPASPQVVAGVPVEVASPMLASGGGSIKPRGLNLETTALAHEVPEYLVGASSGNWKTPLAIGALAALLGVLIWQALGPWEKVAELFAEVPNPKSPLNPASPSIDFDLISESEQVPPGIPEADSVAAAVPAAGSDPNGIEADDATPPGLPPIDVSESDAAPPPGLNPARPNNESSSLQPSTVGQAADASVSSEAPPGLPSSGTTESPPSPPAAPAGSANKLMGAALWLPQDDQAAETVIVAQHGTSLRRVQAGEPLSVPIHLIVPPAMRTTIDLPGGALWTVCGPSLLELDRSDVQASGGAGYTLQPVVSTRLCRALVRGGPDGRAVILVTPLGKHKIEMTSPDSLVSIELAYRSATLGPATDPQATQPVLIIIAAEGDAKLTPLEPAEATQVLKIGDGYGLVAGKKPTKFRLQNIPSWFRGSIERPIDALAAQDLHQRLAQLPEPTSDLGPVLAELCQARRPETAALAIQLSLLCDQWQPLLDHCLGNERMRSHWTPTLHLARQLLASNSTSAANLRGAWVDQFDADGSKLYDVLCGPTAENLRADGLAQIVGLLESPRLDLRVLASYQLQLLTGKNLGFQPATPNRASVQQWRRDLATNRIELLEPLDLIWESVPR
jgi:hypothetical protein